ncbi:unnamed protein product [Nippostrongylus brasiliensis]|uniref:G2/mitotic-specific cyclin-B3 n=1 Tax=Nippostrongylus brasiliensis TaxID=27835 RepID=A0A0N4XKS2_NIPBR|nr:unnamed protein product [Nippostrongylus brasiliensis]
MASVRVGLKQVSNSNNSPSIKVLQAKKSHATSNFSPLKDKTDAHRKQTPGVVHEGKENQAVQVTVPVRASSAQTVVTTSSPAPVITKEDLLSEEPTSSYWRGMAEKFEKEIDAELENSFNVSIYCLVYLHFICILYFMHSYCFYLLSELLLEISIELELCHSCHLISAALEE